MMYKILKMPFFGRFMVKWRNPLSMEQRKKWSVIQVDSKSGVNIKGLFAQTGQNMPKATIVLGHPMGKEAKGFFLKNGYADFLLGNGFNVVVFDINGFGESDCGNFAYYEDILAMGHKTKELCNDLPIGYHGVSLGGQWATIAFADASNPYEFAIIESAATTLDEFWIHYPLAYKILRMLNLLMPKFRKKINMLERIKEAKNIKSILYIYSESDQWTPVSMGKRFMQNTPVNTALWTVKRADHAKIIRSEHSDIYKEKALDFFHENLN
ncbi:hypothetical protein D2V08_01620 [Flagellimonas lutimaris]|uniref:Serine aminopeptidase S33 domain-containing protein n=1 Tax=Flagellimonas lutimaris TaxID=475082 RepID=A0A3A1NAV8_9FLAO|nr:alpha/beta hydrolase [Allomuricauda lutimaris]RIV36707.1 hypothetical protein D2V08_01620 [Allomuricauda lutimaris]